MSLLSPGSEADASPIGQEVLERRGDQGTDLHGRLLKNLEHHHGTWCWAWNSCWTGSAGPPALLSLEWKACTCTHARTTQARTRRGAGRVASRQGVVVHSVVHSVVHRQCLPPVVSNPQQSHAYAVDIGHMPSICAHIHKYARLCISIHTQPARPGPASPAQPSHLHTSCTSCTSRTHHTMSHCGGIQ